MKLKSIIDTELKRRDKTFKWLVSEVGISNDGLKAGLENETIKLKDLKKLFQVLNMPIQMILEGGTTFQSQKGGNYNSQVAHSVVSEPAGDYQKIELEGLRKQVQQLESQIIDKDNLIALYKEKIK